MSKYYKSEDVIAFLNLHCPKDMWEYQIADLPTIEVSEDCISRATALEIYSDLYWTDERLLNFKDELDKVYEKLQNAPSVVPSTEQSSMVGEWIEEVGDCEGKSVRYICNQCGDDDGWINYNYCPNCGSKMKGAE